MAPNVVKARSVVLLTRPVGMASPVLGENIGVKEVDVAVEAPPNGVFVQIKFMSVDPYLRNRIARDSPLNAPIMGHVAGKVLKSNACGWKEGDIFGAHLPFVSYQAVSESDLKDFRNLTSLIDESDLSVAIGILGMPGSTAYAGLDLMGVSANDRVWISAATGAVGSIAGQLAKNVRKCKLVIGSAGSDEKCHVAKAEFGYDACVNYKHATKEKDLTSLIKEAAPEGIDFYFENVGGDHFAAGMTNLRIKGRVAVCGAISRYNEAGGLFQSESQSESIHLGKLIYMQQRVEGFFFTDWLSGARGNFLKDMSSWYKAGLVKKKETVFHGIEKWPEAFHALFTQGGDNLGKIVVKIDE